MVLIMGWYTFLVKSIVPNTLSLIHQTVNECRLFYSIEIMNYTIRLDTSIILCHNFYSSGFELQLFSQ